ncbi:MAG: hypothetical protein P8J27_00385 [Mariniblastus sp.]|nr:hypothetical protein [Mariniblastus sp.]
MAFEGSFLGNHSEIGFGFLNRLGLSFDLLIKDPKADFFLVNKSENGFRLGVADSFLVKSKIFGVQRAFAGETLALSVVDAVPIPRPPKSPDSCDEASSVIRVNNKIRTATNLSFIAISIKN